MGFEISDGRYVTFDKKELDELRPTSTRAIEVTDFVALEDVDPIYYERTYWLAPDGDAAARAYQLLLAAMEERDRVAIGTVAMRNKQYLTAIRPLDGVLAMSTMRFADEVVPRKDIDELPSRRSKPAPKELRMAVQLLDSLASDWDPKRTRTPTSRSCASASRPRRPARRSSPRSPPNSPAPTSSTSARRCSAASTRHAAATPADARVAARPARAPDPERDPAILVGSPVGSPS